MVQFYPWLNFIFHCFKLIIIHYHTTKQREIKFKPRIKLNHNRYLVCLLVEFDLLFAFGVLACRILYCSSLLCGLLSGKLRCLRLKLELLAFGMLRNHIDMFVSFVSSGS